MKTAPKQFLNQDMKKFFFKRKKKAHKGDYGKVLVVGGSKDYTGAPALSALAALRTGADLAVILTASHVANAVRKLSPNIIVKEYAGQHLNSNAVEVFKKIYKKFDSFVIGPGLGKAASRSAMLKIIALLKKEKKRFVVDAEAFSVLKQSDLKNSLCIATPHAREFKLFFKSKFPKDVCVIKKGAVDVVSYKNKKAENYTGNTGMTVGGTGDVLTGCLAAILTQTDDLFKAACAAAYLSGKAGDIAFKEFGNQLLATDVIESLPKAITSLK